MARKKSQVERDVEELQSMALKKKLGVGDSSGPQMKSIPKEKNAAAGRKKPQYPRMDPLPEPKPKGGAEGVARGVGRLLLQPVTAPIQMLDDARTHGVGQAASNAIQGFVDTPEAALQALNSKSDQTAEERTVNLGNAAMLATGAKAGGSRVARTARNLELPKAPIEPIKNQPKGGGRGSISERVGLRNELKQAQREAVLREQKLIQAKMRAKQSKGAAGLGKVADEDRHQIAMQKYLDRQHMPAREPLHSTKEQAVNAYRWGVGDTADLYASPENNAQKQAALLKRDQITRESLYGHRKLVDSYGPDNVAEWNALNKFHGFDRGDGFYKSAGPNFERGSHTSATAAQRPPEWGDVYHPGETSQQRIAQERRRRKEESARDEFLRKPKQALQKAREYQAEKSLKPATQIDSGGSGAEGGQGVGQSGPWAPQSAYESTVTEQGWIPPGYRDTVSSSKEAMMADTQDTSNSDFLRQMAQDPAPSPELQSMQEQKAALEGDMGPIPTEIPTGDVQGAEMATHTNMATGGEAMPHDIAQAHAELAMLKQDPARYIAMKSGQYNQMVARHLKNKEMASLDAQIAQMAGNESGYNLATAMAEDATPPAAPASKAAVAPARPAPAPAKVAPGAARREIRQQTSFTNHGITTGPSSTNHGITTGPQRPAPKRGYPHLDSLTEAEAAKLRGSSGAAAPARNASVQSAGPSAMSERAMRYERAASHNIAADKAIAAGRPNDLMRVGGEVGAGVLQGVGDVVTAPFGLARDLVTQGPVETVKQMGRGLARLPGQVRDAVNPMSDMSAEERTRLAVPLVVGPKLGKMGAGAAARVASKASKALPAEVRELGAAAAQYGKARGGVVADTAAEGADKLRASRPVQAVGQKLDQAKAATKEAVRKTKGKAVETANKAVEIAKTVPAKARASVSAKAKKIKNSAAAVERNRDIRRVMVRGKE